MGHPVIVIPCLGFSQKIEKYYDYQWHQTEAKYARFYSQVEKTDSGWRRRDFFVHNFTLQMEGYYEDSACKIASGRFIYLYPDKKIEMLGRYVQNKKQGAWISFYPDGLSADSTVYDNGNPIGTKLSWHRNSYSADSCIYHGDGSGIEVK